MWLSSFSLILAEVANLFFIVLFTLEMLLKMYSLGFQASSRSNRRVALIL